MNLRRWVAALAVAVAAVWIDSVENVAVATVVRHQRYTSRSMPVPLLPMLDALNGYMSRLPTASTRTSP